jgi:hypothetical protein
MKMTVDVTKYKKRRKKEDMSKAIHYQLQKWTGKTVKQIIRNISGHILQTRSAHLRRSITGKTFKDKLIYAIIGSGIFGRKAVKYARILEKGGIIRPKKAKALTIPLPGVKGIAANYPDAFIIKSKAGNALIVEKRGKTGLKPLFVLKKQVKIPAKHWLSDSIKEMKPDLIRSLRPVEILKIMKREIG